MPLYELFLGSGGLAVAIIAGLAWIAYARPSAIGDAPARWVAALGTPWLMRSAAVISAATWAWSFGRLFAGDAWLWGAGRFAELSTGIAALTLAVAGSAWWGARAETPLRPWLTHGLVLASIFANGAMVRPAPEGDLAQGAGDAVRPAVAFVQGRLAQLGCFRAVGEPPQRDGTFEALTAGAVIAFQQANGLLNDVRLDRPGVVRPGTELRLLARPFPFVFGPQPCPAGSGDGADGTPNPPQRPPGTGRP